MSGLNNDEDKKPYAGDQAAHIILKVKGQDGSEVFFRIRRSTRLKKLMYAYCDRQSVELNSIAFLFDGRRIHGDQTPHELEMEDDDEIDAMLHQTAHINLKFKGQDGSEVWFRIKRSTQLKKVMKIYFYRHSVELNFMSFFFNGRLVFHEQTPDQLGMEEGDKIDVIRHRSYYDQVITHHLIRERMALEEELNRQRKDKERFNDVFMISGRIVFRLYNHLIAGNIDLKEELTRLRKDEEEDVVFIKIGRIFLQEFFKNITLKEEVGSLMEEIARLLKMEDEEVEEEEEGDDDALFMKIGRIVSGLIAENATLNEELTRLKEVLTRLWKDEEEKDTVFMEIGRIVLRELDLDF
ncbi:hypothetical protein L1987_26541 [Smallanthus sonchifolius]|uniref:Uncharacterized protein n=1 Tax=Smallanthus sonchifolius TaxID=185202 RepID=A0ACB9IB94_9ASTR|nr:hypothetical protein L1987_26541 [Smallanthus sonchifolius]